MLCLLLGGAAVYRCDHWLISVSPLAVEVSLLSGQYFSPKLSSGIRVWHPKNYRQECPMNPLASPKCASRVLMALAAISGIIFAAGCGSSSSTSTTNPGGFSDSSLTGTYVISISGTDVNTTTNEVVPFAIVGTITADGKGGLTGTIDINDPYNIGVKLGQSVSSSSGYQVGQDGRGTGTLVTPVGNFNLDFVLTSSNHGLISRFDDNGNDIGTGSGTIDMQTSPTPTPTGSFAFSLSGVDSGGNSLGTVGAFTINSTSIAGTEDFNDDATSGPGYTGLTLTGQLVASTSGPGTAQFNTPVVSTSLDSLNFDVWVIDSTHLKFIETDTAGPYLSGDAFTQVTSLSAGQLVFVLSGMDGTQEPVVAGGYATVTDANGDLSNGVEDYNDNGTVGLGKPFSTSAATCVASTGRCQLTLNGFSNGTSEPFTFAVYPSSGGGGLALEIDSFGLLQGASYSQSATAFTPSGGYGLNLTGVNNLNPNLEAGAWGEVDDIAQFNAGSTASPAVNMTGTLDENDIGDLAPTSSLNGTYTPDTNGDGRGSITAPTTGTFKTLLGGFTLQYYVVDSSTVVFIDVDSTALDGGAAQVAVGTFEAQSSSSSAAAVPMVRPMVRPHAALQRK
jgi:hypothetical protein